MTKQDKKRMFVAGGAIGAFLGAVCAWLFHCWVLLPAAVVGMLGYACTVHYFVDTLPET